MLKLAIAITKEILPIKICCMVVLWQIFAYQLSFHPHLAPSSLGSFLSYQILGIVILLFRFGKILEQRHYAGWIRRSSLRNTYSREVASEFTAGVFAIVIISITSTILLLAWPPNINPKAYGYHPITAKSLTEFSWELSWKQPLPEGSKICLTFNYENAPEGQTNSTLVSSSQKIDITAGEIVYWAPDDLEQREKKIILKTPKEHNLELIIPLARIEVPYIKISKAPYLFLQHIIFFMPVIALGLFIFHVLVVNGSLAMIGAWAMSTLCQFENIALLPNVSSLIASGIRYERIALTTSPLEITTWLSIGGILFILCLRKQSR